jgi:hypothetical protein
MMKKILSTAIVCTLVLGFLSVSDVFAVDTTKLVNKEYRITGVAKTYNSEGNYDGGGQITQGNLFFLSPGDSPAVYAYHNIAPDRYMFNPGQYEYYCITQLGPYTTGLTTIRSELCSMDCYDATGVTTVVSFYGACDAKIVFSSNTAFTGTITIPDYWSPGYDYVLTLSGKFMGRYPLIPDGNE